MTEITILDGGMGRELSARGAPFRQPEWSALALWEAPEQVQMIHSDFIDAGAGVVITNSYALVPYHIGEERFSNEAEQLASLSAELAKKSVQETGKTSVKIAGCLPPLFGSYRPDLFNCLDAERIVTPLIKGQENIVDYWLVETLSSLIEMQTILRLLPDDNKPIWLAFTLEDDAVINEPRIRSGERVADVIKAVCETTASAVLFNCSTPEVMNDAVMAAKHIVEEKRKI